MRVLQKLNTRLKFFLLKISTLDFKPWRKKCFRRLPVYLNGKVADLQDYSFNL